MYLIPFPVCIAMLKDRTLGQIKAVQAERLYCWTLKMVALR
jgi:hypothetical protein